jgi:hypothetical protein
MLGWAVLVYHYDNGCPMFDQQVGGFHNSEEAQRWAETKCEFIPGQDFSVVRIDRVQRDCCPYHATGGSLVNSCGGDIA